jgi:WD40-like Beta Propeller Repeat
VQKTISQRSEHLVMSMSMQKRQRLSYLIHHRKLRSLHLACVVFFVLAAASAQALPVRGHALTGTFGSLGAGDDQLNDPGAIAVSEVGPTAGDVYVLDRANSRIEQFTATGQFIAAWGYDVSTKHAGKPAYEVCESECGAGLEGEKKYQLSAGALTIAVDNSAGPSQGDVYLATPLNEEEEYEQIDKFTSDGQPIEAVHVIKYLTGKPVGKTEKQRNKEEKEHTETAELEASETHGLAVGPDGTVWLYYEEEIYSLGDAGLKSTARVPLEPELQGEPASGLAIDAHEDFYIPETIEDPPQPPLTVLSEWKLAQSEAGLGLQLLTQEVDGEQTAGITVSRTKSEVFLGNENAEHELSVAGFGEAGRELERFGEGQLHSVSSVAVDGGAEDGHGEVYVADTTADDVQMFGREAAGPPRVDDVSTQDVGSNSVQLDGEIDPHGAPTTYQFEYGTPAVSCASEPTACARLASAQLAKGPDEGFGDVAVSEELEAATGAPLLADTTYHYRLTANHEGGSDEGSREGTFTTQPVKESLADDRVWELVSPAQKNGAEVDPPTREGAAIQAASGGGALAYVTDAPLEKPEGNRSFEVTQDLSTRGPEGWSTKDIVTPNERGTGLVVGKGEEYKLFSSDLSLAAVQPFVGGGISEFAEPPLSPPVSQAERQLAGEGKPYQERTMYLRQDSPLAPNDVGEAEQMIYEQAGINGEIERNPGYLALVTEQDALSGFGSEAALLEFVDATPDLSRVLIRAKVPLTRAEGEGEGAIPAPTAAPVQNLYEWSPGNGQSPSRIQLVSVIEEAGQSVAAREPELGAKKVNVRHAISIDGSHVFWEGEDPLNEEKHLYMRDTVTHKTLQLDTRQPGVESAGEEVHNPEFQSASADGLHVFFTDEERLTEDAGAKGHKPDLYLCEIIEVAGKPKCELTDLTPAQESGESAGVQGVVLGTSDDGSYIYFVADGVLAPGASPGRCGQDSGPNVVCNIYVDHHTSTGWEMRFIESLSAADAADWHAGVAAGETGEPPPDLGRISVSVSPDGRYLAFMSERRLLTVGDPSGYDNRVTNPEADEAPAEEVFLFDAESGQPASKPASESVVCVSCDSSGARPHGVYDPRGEEDEGPEGIGLLVDRAQTWEGHWLAGSIPSWTNVDKSHALYQPRYLSNSGRLFFESPADLVPEAVNEKEDVYEYEPEGVPSGRHSCASSSATFVAPEGGCVGLISSGVSAHESAFLDASETGGESEKEEEGGSEGEGEQEGGDDVFFVTTEKLAPEDVDGSFDVYDAHECTVLSECIPPASPKEQAFCESTPECRASASAGVPLGSPASGISSTGNYVPPAKSGNKGVTVKSPPRHKLTRAQELARTLKACHKLKHKHKRIACEKQARKKYGAHNAKKAGAKSSAARKPVRGGR